MSEDKCRDAFEAWYGENVSCAFDGKHCGIYDDNHAVFGSDVWSAYQAAYESQQAELTRLREALEVAEVALETFVETPASDMNIVGVKAVSVEALTKINELTGGENG